MLREMLRLCGLALLSDLGEALKIAGERRLMHEEVIAERDKLADEIIKVRNRHRVRDELLAGAQKRIDWLNEEIAKMDASRERLAADANAKIADLRRELKLCADNAGARAELADAQATSARTVRQRLLSAIEASA